MSGDERPDLERMREPTMDAPSTANELVRASVPLMVIDKDPQSISKSSGIMTLPLPAFATFKRIALLACHRGAIANGPVSSRVDPRRRNVHGVGWCYSRRDF
jgi:hypothetical protein